MERIEVLEERVRQLELKEVAQREQMRTAYQRIEAMTGSIDRMSRSIEHVAEQLGELRVTSQHQERQMRWLLGAAWSGAGSAVLYVVMQVLSKSFG